MAEWTPQIHYEVGRSDASAADREIEAAVLRTLADHYPRHDWFCEASVAQGVAVIRHLGLNQAFPQYAHLGYKINLDVLDEHSVMVGGGTLLEFFNVDRTPGAHEWHGSAHPSDPVQSFGKH